MRPFYEADMFIWRKLGSLATHEAHSEDSVQTGRSESSLGTHATLLVLSWGGSYCMFTSMRKNFIFTYIWTASSEFGTYSLCEQRRFRRACASAQSRQNLRCSLIQAVNQEEPSNRKPDPWPLWMAGHAQLKFVMTECSKTQIRLTRLTCKFDPLVI